MLTKKRAPANIQNANQALKFATIKAVLTKFAKNVKTYQKLPSMEKPDQSHIKQMLAFIQASHDAVAKQPKIMAKVQQAQGTQQSASLFEKDGSFRETIASHDGDAPVTAASIKS